MKILRDLIILLCINAKFGEDRLVNGAPNEGEEIYGPYRKTIVKLIHPNSTRFVNRRFIR